VSTLGDDLVFLTVVLTLCVSFAPAAIATHRAVTFLETSAAALSHESANKARTFAVIAIACWGLVPCFVCLFPAMFLLDFVSAGWLRAAIVPLVLIPPAAIGFSAIVSIQLRREIFIAPAFCGAIVGVLVTWCGLGTMAAFRLSGGEVVLGGLTAGMWACSVVFALLVPRSARQIALRASHACQACRYSLDGLPADTVKCPECGGPIPPVPSAQVS
jgi:hypothetical protein